MKLARKRAITVPLAIVSGSTIAEQYFFPASATLLIVAIAVFMVTAPMAVYYWSQHTDWNFEAESLVKAEKIKNNIDEEKTDDKS